MKNSAKACCQCSCPEAGRHARKTTGQEKPMTTRKTISPWAKPRGRFEIMAAYQAICGFKPTGPHTVLVRELMRNITVPCPQCGGTGLDGTYGGLGWRACPACHGLGKVYAITPAELEKRRQKVLAQYPEAGVSNWRPGIPARCPVQNLKTGEILDACPPLDEEQLELF
jgi:hypothetical protein